ncbi:hypothetical protein PHYPO_G00105170 [Pangasianodon hypophthalmus]|uniref:RING-CH-type domain-containing protein n=1 Tax=Pangasianodon hypophthalmus TaxID=310915 RepID=A0A5N5PX69_PANHP|nr:uncharacterized protein LOC113536767 isoform X1 [Pangasianodon hypophthalmus]KAB5584244.1 hypothetical protein PHYPO_G00105170 [Pangasianodon hypophthalmus]
MMDDGCADTCKVLVAETPECFICREVQLVDGEQLKRFCDCKNLMAHHSCLLTWVRMGLKREDQLRCRVCNAEYQQQRVAPWQSVASQWRVWPVLVVAVVMAALVPYTVFCMLTVFDNDHPHTLFNMAAICFGILSEILLLRLLYCYITNHFRKAQRASFSLQPRNLEEVQEAGVRGHDHKADALWQWKSSPVVEKAKQIDSQ